MAAWWSVAVQWTADSSSDAWVIRERPDLVPFSASGDPPPARSAATLINDAARGRYLLFGGMNADGVLDDLWELGAT